MTDLREKPANSQWTDDQWKAIVSTGQDTLVAAAAGSGKTAVLVERIIGKLIDERSPIDVDQLLVVTFTNASAAEMKHRIGEALEKELKKAPSSLHLRRQLNLLNKASISTLHSFCLNVIRNYYYKIDIDPSFRIADDTEAELLRDEALQELFEDYYSREDNLQFLDVVDRYTSDRSDAEIQEIVRKMYEFSQSTPSPSTFLDELLLQYKVNENTRISDLSFMPFLMNEVRKQLHSVEDLLNQGLALTKKPDGPAPRSINFEEDLEQLQKIQSGAALSFEEAHEAMRNLTFSRLKPCKKGEYDQNLVDQSSDIRKTAKEKLEKLQSELFSRPLTAYIDDMIDMKPVIEVLTELVKEFSKRYSLKKREKGLVDFGDLEHYCLAILTEERDGEIERSAIAKQYVSQFHEVLVDEYQDTNMVQETIIKLVTRDEESTGNLFMVGDVKQSIYRFRLAEPFLFLNKYKRFTKDGRTGGLRIDLNKNFRSRSEVLDATNYLFCQIMDEGVGEISYDSDAELKRGASYPQDENMATELHLIEKNGADVPVQEGEFSTEELETSQLEARLMAGKIKEMVQNRFQVYDAKKGITRNVTYRDFVILLRSMTWAPQILEEFKEQGVPLYANLSKGYFEATEVTIMLSLLKVIDNPYQDIPLASVLRSPLVRLNDEELASIRLYDEKGTYYEALKAYLKEASAEDEKYKNVEHFYHCLLKWRKEARQRPLYTLIWNLYRETGFFEFVGGLPGGKQRQANLNALYDRARQYESTSFRGLFRFLRFIERMQERGDDLGTARALGEQEDVVRLMTIHSSKGLEFPIVFLGGIGRSFNLMDVNKSYLFHKELGFGSKRINPRLRVAYPTLIQQAMKRKIRRESIAEEMRVLYVALTRAKEKLILVGTTSDKEKLVNKWESVFYHEDILLQSAVREEAKSYLDWIVPSLIRHRDFESFAHNQPASNQELYNHPSKWELNVVPSFSLQESEKKKEEEDKDLVEAIKNSQQVKIQSPYREEIERRLGWRYAYQQASKTKSKQSVSELKRQSQLLDEEEQTKGFQKPITERPLFLQAKKLTSAEKGTAMHTVMQHIPLKTDVTAASLLELCSSLITREILTEKEASSININGLLSFFESEVGQRLQQAPSVYREMPFSFSAKASELEQNWEGKEEPVLIQGIIDCLFRDEKGVVLLDFKTDDIANRFQGNFEKARDTLLSRYKTQLNLYTRAVEEIGSIHISERYLYFFDGGHFLSL
jgi:ATP-dependent helicase/nuclease subunit A